MCLFLGWNWEKHCVFCSFDLGLFSSLDLAFDLTYKEPDRQSVNYMSWGGGNKVTVKDVMEGRRGNTWTWKNSNTWGEGCMLCETTHLWMLTLLCVGYVSCFSHFLPPSVTWIAFLYVDRLSRCFACEPLEQESFVCKWDHYFSLMHVVGSLVLHRKCVHLSRKILVDLQTCLHMIKPRILL